MKSTLLRSLTGDAEPLLHTTTKKIEPAAADWARATGVGDRRISNLNGKKKKQKEKESPVTIHDGDRAATNLLFRANLHGLHAGISFGFGLECSVVDDRGCRGRRLLIDNSAFLGGGITYDIELGCSLRKDRRNRKYANSANNQKPLHRFLQCKRTRVNQLRLLKFLGEAGTEFRLADYIRATLFPSDFGCSQESRGY